MNRNRIPVALFRFGRIVATPNALSKLTHEDILAAIQRHQAGDWGELGEEDKNGTVGRSKQASAFSHPTAPQTARSSGSSPNTTVRPLM